MKLQFTLSMPSVNSWNGKWSGDGNLYAIVESFRGKTDERRAKEILDKGYFHYNFGDGWSAGVKVAQIDNKEANKIMRKTQGFCGYDWMVRSIINKLKIESN